MNNRFIIVLFIVSTFASVSVGFIVGSKQSANPKKTADTPLYWVAPMDASYRRNGPGKSPMGMDLIPVYTNDEKPEGKSIAGTVTISPNVQNNFAVKLSDAIEEDVILKIRTVGIVQFDENSISHTHARVEGWVETLYADAIGEPVSQGQKLFDLYSPELINAQKDHLAALKQGNRSLIDSSEKRLISLGINSKHIKQLQRTNKVTEHMPFYSDREGYVTELNIRKGMFIDPATSTISVGSLHKVWVIAEIFEQQVSWIEKGQPVLMQTPSFPNKNWVGVVDYLYPVLDPKNRTLRARIVFDNPHEHLKPNMFTNLTINAKKLDNIITIPKDAIIRQGKMERVVKALDKNKFVSVRVKTGIENDYKVQIIDGLKAGDKVVTSSQFLIDSESSISADLSRIGLDDKSNIITAVGEIKTVMQETKMVKITHEPIPELNWPVMTMMFFVEDNIDLSKLIIGHTIDFTFIQDNNGDYIIQSIAPHTNRSEPASTHHNKRNLEANHD